MKLQAGAILAPKSDVTQSFYLKETGIKIFAENNIKPVPPSTNKWPRIGDLFFILIL